MAKNKFYAVVRGVKPGIYDSWFGENGAKAQVDGFSGAIHQGFKTRTEAEEWYSENKNIETTSFKKKEAKQSKKARSKESDTKTKVSSKLRKVVFYTDGGCINNPGPGGYGVVCIEGRSRKNILVVSERPPITEWN